MVQRKLFGYRKYAVRYSHYPLLVSRSLLRYMSISSLICKDCARALGDSHVMRQTSYPETQLLRVHLNKPRLCDSSWRELLPRNSRLWPWWRIVLRAYGPGT